jgi:lysyl-tRNA synthetase class 2
MSSEVQTQNDSTAESTEYYQLRTKHLEDMKSAGTNPYPHKFEVDMTYADYIKRYNSIEAGAHMEEVEHTVAGRVMEVRSAGKKLFFCTTRSNFEDLQFIFNVGFYKGDFAEVAKIARGDIVGVRGFVGKSKNGELSIFGREMQILTPCLKELPKMAFGVKDEELRVKKRYLDLMINKESIHPFLVRNKVIRGIRKYLDDRDFLEVQTPILSGEAGGANAKPFVTYHNDLKRNMFMRIAPELYLKKLVVGGMNRVYELGAQFRNENLDSSHQCEFTSLELYVAYADYNNLMTMCEELYSKLAVDICGSHKIKYTPPASETEYDVDLTPPYRRIDIVEELNKHLNVDLNDLLKLDQDALRQALDKLCVDNGVDCSSPRTAPRLLDKLIGKYIEPQCINPTFVMNHPAIMSPLSKQHRDNPNLTERFELFICGFEFANAYTELNDPIIQKERFEEQMKSKAMGDEEAQDIDHGFIDALEYGLPPTGGFGTGIDRLAMLLSNRSKIRDVVTFPMIH